MSLRKPLPLAASLLIAALWLAPALAQQNLASLKDPAFGETVNKAVPFLHNAHNEKAGLKDCSACHHVYDQNGQRVKGAASVDKKCSDCHKVRPAPSDFAPGLMMAYHRLCQDCHKEQKKGPVACGQCHKK